MVMKIKTPKKRLDMDHTPLSGFKFSFPQPVHSYFGLSNKYSDLLQKSRLHVIELNLIWSGIMAEDSGHRVGFGKMF